MELEYKTFDFKVDETNEAGSFKGYLAVFNNVDHGKDRILPGAFKDTLATLGERGTKLPILWMHDRDHPLGVYEKLTEDQYGLFVEGKLNLDVQSAREKHSLMKQGAITGMSIGYGTDEANTTKEGIRDLIKLTLAEGSLVTSGFAMNDQAQITAVKTKDDFTDIRALEAFLRDAGMSKTTAKAVAAHGYNGITTEPRRDAGADVEIVKFIKSLAESMGASNGTRNEGSSRNSW